MATLASFDFRVGWDPVASDAFIIGQSTFDDNHVFGSQLYTDFGGTYDNIGSYVQGFTVKAGREDGLSETPMGECTIRLTDPDGRFNPLNTSSPLYGSIIPMRPVRIQATHDGTTYGVFRGYISDIEHNPLEKTTTILAGDMFLWLSRVYPVVTSTATTTGGAIGLLLDAIGMSEMALRDVDPNAGDAITFSSDGSTSALELIGGLLEAEQGVFFIDPSGVATYRDRAWLQTNTTSVATVSSSLVVLPGFNVHNIRNRFRVTKEGGTQQEASDGDSQSAFGWSDAVEITSPYLEDDAHALRLAHYLAARYSNFYETARELSQVNESVATVTSMLSVGLQDRITVTDSALDSGDYIVEGYTLMLDGIELRRSSVLSRVDPEWFVIEESTFNDAHALGY